MKPSNFRRTFRSGCRDEKHILSVLCIVKCEVRFFHFVCPQFICGLESVLYDESAAKLIMSYESSVIIECH